MAQMVYPFTNMAIDIFFSTEFTFPHYLEINIFLSHDDKLYVMFKINVIVNL